MSVKADTNSGGRRDNTELVGFAHANKVPCVWYVKVAASVDFIGTWLGSSGFLVGSKRDAARVDNHRDGSCVGILFSTSLDGGWAAATYCRAVSRCLG